jgi:hypothetical protein
MRSRGPASPALQGEAAFGDPIAAALIVVVQPGDLIRSGLGVDRCDLLIATPDLTGKDARVLRALDRLARAVVLPPTASTALVEATRGAELHVAGGTGSPARVAAAAMALRS